MAMISYNDATCSASPVETVDVYINPEQCIVVDGGENYYIRCNDDLSTTLTYYSDDTCSDSAQISQYALVCNADCPDLDSGSDNDSDSCADTCANEPTTCDEYTAMTSAGGCASSCSEEYLQPYRDALGCSGDIVCDGYTSDEYCDCGGDCSAHASDWCSCSAAQTCCASSSPSSEITTLAPTMTAHVASVEFMSTLAISVSEASTDIFQDAYKQAVADAAGILEYYVRIINIQAGSKRRRVILQGADTTEITTEALFVNSVSDAEAFASSSSDTLSIDTGTDSYTAAVGTKTVVLPPSPPSPPPAPIVSSNVWQAAKMGSLYEVKHWVQTGADVNGRYEDGVHHKEGSTALREATWAGWYEVVEYLLDNGAHVNTKDADKFAPTHYAAKRGNEGVLKLLLSRGGRVNARNKKNETPLHLAADTGRLSVVKMLLAEKKIDVNSKNYVSLIRAYFLPSEGLAWTV
ncbi:hypothetical protein CYMTET_15574 [Cymbomonas tetramitiformis]|uniref:Uncharacterized protein n=1 Tax=Cymbomonas tetramitiformis TaxID=36881 RepID=A0AAE0GE21_9CHLO|nr:hypothetical protein CYMTET_15574 [Cymbomonas tetramitiformis]